MATTMAEIRETIAQVVKIQQETARIWQEMVHDRQEAERQFKETDKKFNELADSNKNLRREIEGMSDSNGFVAEDLVFDSLTKKMTFGGITFDRIEQGRRRSVKLADGTKVTGEYDVMLSNGTIAAVIEVKYRVRREDVEKLLNKQLPKIRLLFPEYKDFEMILGIGGMAFEKGVEEEALSKGIGTLKLNGDFVEINDKDVKVFPPKAS